MTLPTTIFARQIEAGDILVRKTADNLHVSMVTGTIVEESGVMMMSVEGKTVSDCYGYGGGIARLLAYGENEKVEVLR